jgi:hypothetical protein
MTLHEAVRHFRLIPVDDYHQHDTVNGKIVALYGLGLYAADLWRLKVDIPRLSVRVLRSVERDNDRWVRVDVVESR